MHSIMVQLCIACTYTAMLYKGHSICCKITLRSFKIYLKHTCINLGWRKFLITIFMVICFPPPIFPSIASYVYGIKYVLMYVAIMLTVHVCNLQHCSLVVLIQLLSTYIMKLSTQLVSLINNLCPFLLCQQTTLTSQEKGQCPQSSLLVKSISSHHQLMNHMV